jgi:hypothetical protein
MKRDILAVLTLAVLAPVALSAHQPVYLDPSQPIDKRTARETGLLVHPDHGLSGGVHRPESRAGAGDQVENQL